MQMQAIKQNVEQKPHNASVQQAKGNQNEGGKLGDVSKKQNID